MFRSDRAGRGTTHFGTTLSYRAAPHDLPDDQLRYLATVGLAELVTQEHRIDRLIGDQLAITRYPELEPYSNPSA